VTVRAQPIPTARLDLLPLTVDHAAEMALTPTTTGRDGERRWHRQPHP
jgi:hypothetical protein